MKLINNTPILTLKEQLKCMKWVLKEYTYTLQRRTGICSHIIYYCRFKYYIIISSIDCIEIIRYLSKYKTNCIYWFKNDDERVNAIKEIIIKLTRDINKLKK